MVLILIAAEFRNPVKILMFVLDYESIRNHQAIGTLLNLEVLLLPILAISRWNLACELMAKSGKGIFL